VELAAHAESSINGLGYWLVPGNNCGDCLLLGVNGQGRLMHCTVLRQTILCCSHVNWWMRSQQTLSDFHWACPREQQCSLYPPNLHCDAWCPGHCCTKMLLEVEFQSRQLWLHACPFMTDDYTHLSLHYWWLHTVPSLLMIIHLSLQYWWLHTCPFITDDYTRVHSLQMITHVSIHYWWLHTRPFITDANHLIIVLNPMTSWTHCTEYLSNEVNVVGKHHCIMNVKLQCSST